ncbi:hypothetical protein ACXX9E_29585 [Pseudomonas sp. GNP014]
MMVLRPAPEPDLGATYTRRTGGGLRIVACTEIMMFPLDQRLVAYRSERVNSGPSCWSNCRPSSEQRARDFDAEQVEHPGIWFLQGGALAEKILARDQRSNSWKLPRKWAFARSDDRWSPWRSFTLAPAMSASASRSANRTRSMDGRPAGHFRCRWRLALLVYLPAMARWTGIAPLDQLRKAFDQTAVPIRLTLQFQSFPMN